MAAAEGVGLVANGQQQVHRLGKPALSEGIDGLHDGQAHFTGHAGVGVLARSRRLHGLEQVGGSSRASCGGVGCHRVHVVEDVKPGFVALLVGISQLVPAHAGIDAIQMHAPQQRRGIEHHQLHPDRLGSDAAVIERQRFGVAALIQIKERGMPPVVKRKPVVALRPMRLA